MDNKEFIFKMVRDIRDEIYDIKNEIHNLENENKLKNMDELLETKINNINNRVTRSEKNIDNIIAFCMSLVPEVPPTEEEIAVFDNADKMQGNAPLVRHEDINWDLD